MELIYNLLLLVQSFPNYLGTVGPEWKSIYLPILSKESRTSFVLTRTLVNSKMPNMALLGLLNIVGSPFKVLVLSLSQKRKRENLYSDLYFKKGAWPGSRCNFNGKINAFTQILTCSSEIYYNIWIFRLNWCQWHLFWNSVKLSHETHSKMCMYIWNVHIWDFGLKFRVFVAMSLLVVIFAVNLSGWKL